MRISVAVLLICLLCACFANAAGAWAEISYEPMNWTYSFEDVPLADIRVTYPHVSGLDEEVCKKINAAIKEYVVSSGGFDDTCAYAREDYTENYAKFAETERYGLDAAAKVTYNSDRLIAVRYDFTVHTGGAHPWDTIAAQHYDAQTGYVALLSELVSDWPAFQSKVAALIKHALTTAAYSEFDFDFYDVTEWPARQGLLTDEGLLVFYQEGDLGPVSAGPFELVIPYALLSEYFMDGLGLP